jgi:predicted lipid-binding transport protein (Tim44 family)
MSVLGIMVLGVISDGGMRSMLFILLILAVIFLVAGAALAIMALRSQRKVAPDVATLEQLEDEAS